jgi:hypothetical protein
MNTAGEAGFGGDGGWSLVPVFLATQTAAPLLLGTDGAAAGAVAAVVVVGVGMVIGADNAFDVCVVTAEYSPMVWACAVSASPAAAAMIASNFVFIIFLSKLPKIRI